MTRDEALAILHEWTKTESLLRHARTVELVMRALARREGADEELWGLTGLLHDADYETFPDEHPARCVARLRELGEEEMAHAIGAHYTKWGVPHETRMDQALIAVDELSGFVTACSHVHPEGIVGLTTKSVRKKFKQKSFAAKVEREEMLAGAEIFGAEINDLIGFIIEVLREHREELGLRGAPSS